VDDNKLPKDNYSTTLRGLQANPSCIEKTSLVDLADFLGNSETWIVKTLRVDGNDTVFLQRNNAEGGDRWVLPPAVTSVIARQRESAVTVVRKRGASKAAATRKAAR
jgi:hypothetical protein